jgi:penicillin-binding protein 2
VSEERLRDFDSGRFEEERRRLKLMTFFILGVFALFVLRLWYMQFIMGSEYRRLSENNRIRIRDIQPCRGLVYDRQGVLLVDNRPCFDLCLVPEEVKDKGFVLRQLSFVSGVPLAELEARLAAAKGKPPFLPVVLIPDADRDLVAKVEMHHFDVPGISIEVRPKRYYLYPWLAPHLLGYLGEANPGDLEHDERLLPGDFVGKYGIEMASQQVLAGVHGRRRIEVDACGREIRRLGEVDPTYGRSVQLTIDFDLQRVAQEALLGKVGAVLAMDVNTGEVLALASSPIFDPNNFVGGLKREIWKGLRDDPGHPLHNRAVQAAYPPGSTYKIIIALAALQEGVIKPDTRIHCPGGYFYGNRYYRCWREKGHGTVDLHRALVESCDTYFYRVGLALGVDRIAHYAKAFGLGGPVGLGLGTESKGLVPSSQWKMKRFGQSWQRGETLSVAIGQGYNLTTPFQMLRVIAAMANGGKIVHPRLVKGVEEANGVIRQTLQPEVVGRLPFSPENLELVKQALVGVVHEGGGTGGAARTPLVTAGGKTGTAQVVALPPGLPRDIALPPEWRDHAWFIAFAPAELPRIAVAILMEHGGHGGSAAAPVARALFEAAAQAGYFGPPAQPPDVQQVQAPSAPAPTDVRQAQAAAAPAPPPDVRQVQAPAPVTPAPVKPAPAATPARACPGGG